MNAGSSGRAILQLWKGSSYVLEIVENSETLGDVGRTIIIDLDKDETLIFLIPAFNIASINSYGSVFFGHK